LEQKEREESLSRDEAVVLVDHIAAALAYLGITPQTLRELGLNKLLGYLALLYAWGRHQPTSRSELQPIPPALAEQMKEVLDKYPRRGGGQAPNGEAIIEAAKRALDRLSSFTTVKLR